jgi:predicted ABC-type ATPase
MRSSHRPSVVILAGPNGAGKSTVAPALLHGALAVNEFVNADVIASGLSAFDPESAAIAAGRVMLSRIRELASQRVNFAFETTLASRSFAPWLRQLATSGYAVHLVYLWLPSADFAVERVAERVRAGGHNVPVGNSASSVRGRTAKFLQTVRTAGVGMGAVRQLGATAEAGCRRSGIPSADGLRSRCLGRRPRAGKTMKPDEPKDIDRIFREDRPRIDEALKQGVREAMIRHKKDGLPVVIYRDGKTVEVKPEDLGF